MSLLHSALVLPLLLVFAVAIVAALVTRPQHPTTSWGVVAVAALAGLTVGGVTLFFAAVDLFGLSQWIPELAWRGITLGANVFEALLIMAAAVIAARGDGS